MSADFLDRYSRGATVCHRLPPRLKIIVTLLIIVAALLVPISHWPVHGSLICLVFVALSLAEIPVRYLVRRIGLFLPLVAFLALSIPLSHGFRSGFGDAAGIVLRSLVAFLAALWLVNTTPFDRMLAGLCGLGMPRIFAAMLSFTYRYVFVLFDELARMRTAQRARTFGRRGIWPAWKSSAQLVAMLLIRSMERAERIHGAMCARGWNGTVHPLE